MQESKNFVGNLLDSRYMVTDVIGRGGSACVYRANDVLLNRAVALKILEDDKNELHINTKSFETEVRAIARLSHPNIVNVFDISMEGSIKYIVMECVEGITLSTYLKHKKVLPISEAVSCARQVLRALREAHEKGIVHRDIKPQNIMIMKNGQIKVADFGIARLPDRDSFRMEDRSIGTVHYISPEQAKGGAVDQRSDLYSLAIVMYEMLTGKRPFEASSPSDVVMMQVTETPVRPSEINPAISAELDSFIMRALSKRPENRFDSASDMLRLLERINPSGEVWGATKRPFFAFKKNKNEKPHEKEPETADEEFFETESEDGLVCGSVEKVEFANDGEYEELDDAESGVYFSATDNEELSEPAKEYNSEAEEPNEVFEETEETDEAEQDREAEETSEGDAENLQMEEVEGIEDDGGGFEFEEKTEDIVPFRKSQKEKRRKRPKSSVDSAKVKAAAIYLGSLFAVALVVVLSLFIYNANKLYTVPFYTVEPEGEEIFSISVKREFSSVYPEGAVISQSVAGGERCKRGTEIILTVSDGPETVRFVIPEGAYVDNLVSQLNAQIEAGGYGISIKTEYEYSGALARGLCFAIDETVCVGGLLKVRVSAGTEKTYVEIPNFVGGKLSDAVDFLNENNVVFELVYGGGDGDVNTVISQSIQSGKRTEAYVEAGKIILTFGGRGN